MGILVTLIAGLVVWIVLWAFGIKSIDAFMITLAMLIVAVAGRILSPFLPGNRTDEEPRTGGSWVPR
jgi:hypothetical protein